ncbi:MAG: hypothetical protein LBV54_05700, partial [Puniceicoccales bacterium]|nr:hypothetical protein [Puniceicoccales bacterium]
MTIPVPAFCRKPWFYVPTAVIVFLGAIVILNALSYKEPSDNWFISIEKWPPKTEDNIPSWSELTAPAIPRPASWKPKTPKLEDSSMRKEKDVYLIEHKGVSVPPGKLHHQSPIVYANADGVATLSDGTVVTLQEATLTLHDKKHTFAVKSGKIVYLPEKESAETYFTTETLKVLLSSSKTAKTFSGTDIFGAGESSNGFSWPQNNDNSLRFLWPFYIYCDSPSRFCAFINHGEPEYVEIPAKGGAEAIGELESFRYLGEMQNFTECRIKRDDGAGVEFPEIQFGSDQGKRVCVFIENNVQTNDPVRRYLMGIPRGNKIKAILEDGREFIVTEKCISWPFSFYTLPKEVGKIPVKSFVFERLPQLSRVAFNIPSLIEFFPENKGVKNRFDLKIPKITESDPRILFSYGLGINKIFLDSRSFITGGRVELIEYPLAKDKKFDFSGKTYREALIEYIRAHKGLNMRDVVVNTNKGVVYVKMPLKVRL